MNEYASHNQHRHDEGRRQNSKSSTSNASTFKSQAYCRMLAEPMDKRRGEAFTSINKEINRKSLPSLSNMSCKRGMEEKSNGLFLEDFKILRKSDIRPSDSSYTRKLFWDANNCTEASSIAHSSKSHQVKDIKLDCHIATKHTDKMLTDNHKKKLDPLYVDKKKVVERLKRHLTEIEQMNGISHDNHSNTLPIYRTVDQMVNGFCHSEINQSLSRDSSHLQSHGPESNNNLLPNSHKRCPDLEKNPIFTKYQSPVQSQNHRSPALSYVPYNNPKDEYSSATSQKLVSDESSSRPNSSLWNEEDNSNDYKSLAVNLSNPTTNSDNTVASTPEKPRYPYSIEMKEGMFKTVKEGPESETLKVHIVENFGSGDLRDGGFSWGWSIEQKSAALPSSKTSSASKEKNSSANKDIHKSKRRLEYEKTSCSPTQKKSKVKGSNPEVLDTKSNREKSSKVCVEVKEIKSKSNHVIPPKHSSPYMKPYSEHGEKSAMKSSKSSYTAPADAKKSPIAGRSQNSEKHCALAFSPVERKKSPIYVPSSEMISHLPKTDCLGKNNVIDDSTMGFISSKKERSAVYSGRKSALEVQPLKVMCFESVKKNILCLKIGRNVPFELLMPALKLCSPSKLHKVEEHNRHILRRTDCLWKNFCESEFREQKRLNGETWKDVYWKARNLRDKKLKNLAASISNGMAKAHPERQAKWVGVGTNNPEKRQRKTKVEEVHRSEVHRIEEIPIARPEANGKGNGSSSTHNPPSTKKRSGSESSSSSSPQSAQKPSSQSKIQVSKAAKKTLAPLMSKTKKMLNFVNRRR